MPIYEPVTEADDLSMFPEWVYFDETRDRESITLKTAGLTAEKGVFKSGVPLVKDTDGTFKKAAAGTPEKPTAAAGLLLFDVPDTGRATAPAVLFTRGTVNSKLPALPANLTLPVTIRTQA